MKRQGNTKIIENYENASYLYHFHCIYCFLRLVLYVPHISMSLTMPRYEKDMLNWFRIQLLTRNLDHRKNIDGLCFGHRSCREIRKHPFFQHRPVWITFSKGKSAFQKLLWWWLSHSSGNWALLQGHSPL